MTPQEQEQEEKGNYYHLVQRNGLQPGMNSLLDRRTGREGRHSLAIATYI